jgi:hypothetical protein
MNARRASFLAAAILVGIAALFFLNRKPAGAASPNRSSPAAASAPTPSASPAIENRKSKIENPITGVSHIADELNAPNGTIRRDLEILDEAMVTFRTNFPRTGNPVGENAEITAALCGDNPAHFAFIPRTHPAINARGELCDRWGTPFRFHQLSGELMEIRSAGPDKKFGTADDADFTPSSPFPIPR